MEKYVLAWLKRKYGTTGLLRLLALYLICLHSIHKYRVVTKRKTMMISINILDFCKRSLGPHRALQILWLYIQS